MGTQIRCRKGGHVLFEFDEAPHDVIWYSRLRHLLSKKCVNHGHKRPNVLEYAGKMWLEVKLVFPVFVRAS